MSLQYVSYDAQCAFSQLIVARSLKGFLSFHGHLGLICHHSMSLTMLNVHSVKLIVVRCPKGFLSFHGHLELTCHPSMSVMMLNMHSVKLIVVTYPKELCI